MSSILAWNLLLGTTPASFEPFRSPVAVNEIRSCLAKLFDLHTELIR